MFLDKTWWCNQIINNKKEQIEKRITQDASDDEINSNQNNRLIEKLK